MQRVLFFLVLLSVPLAAGACNDDHRGRYVQAHCLRYTSCGTCTPVRGCGWCANNRGSGSCLSQPNECAGDQFTWTWEPSACAAAADGGSTDAAAVTPDAGWSVVTDAAVVDGGDGGVCRWPAAANTFSAADGGLSGCLPSVGGNLCATAQYTLTCHGQTGSAVPDPALQCTVVPVPTPSGVLYYCCPCG